MSATIELIASQGQVIHSADYATTTLAVRAQQVIASQIRAGSAKLWVTGDHGTSGYAVQRGDITSVRLNQGDEPATERHFNHDHRARSAGDS